MNREITESFLQVVAGDIEKLLLENQEKLNFAYTKIPDGIKVNMGISLDPSSDGIVVSYSITFDMEPKPEAPTKHKVTYKHVINEKQVALEFIGKEMREGRMSMTIGGETFGSVK